SNGHLLWKTPPLGDGETADIYKQYTTKNGVYVFAGHQNSKERSAGVLVGIDAKSGATRWQADLGAVDLGAVDPFDWYLDGPVLVGVLRGENGSNSVRGVRRTTGKTVWTVPVEAGWRVGDVVVDGDRVVLGLSGVARESARSLRVLDARTGTQ